MTLLLTNDDVAQVLDMQASLRALEPAYQEVAEGKAVLRRQSQSYLPGALADSSYCLKTVEGGSETLGVMAIRLTSDVLRGRMVGDVLRREKVAAAPGHRFLGLVLLFSTETGELLAIIPDGYIQRLRVGAASALAADHLARNDAAVVGLIGAGHQAEAQVRGLACVRQLREVRVYSPTPENRKELAGRLEADLKVPMRPVASAREAVEGADIVASATNSGSPTVQEEWLRPGMHVGFIREFETDEAMLRRADTLVVHTRQGDIDHYTPRGRDELAQLQRGRGYSWDSYPELAELVAGRAKGRGSPDELTMFMNNFGIGIQFSALGAAAWQEAQRHGLGNEIPSDWFLEELQP